MLIHEAAAPAGMFQPRGAIAEGWGRGERRAGCCWGLDRSTPHLPRDGCAISRLLTCVPRQAFRSALTTLRADKFNFKVARATLSPAALCSFSVGSTGIALPLQAVAVAA